MFGAFGAHGLKVSLSSPIPANSPQKVLESDPEGARKLANWQTAAHYQMIHALCLLATSIKMAKNPRLSLAGTLFSIGIVGFSGSIYWLVLDRKKTFTRLMGPVTPIGGLFLIGGWMSLLLL